MAYRVGIKLVVSPIGLDRRVALCVFLDELLGTLDASRTHSHDGVCDVCHPTATIHASITPTSGDIMFLQRTL